jgi:hypothetical protein
MGEERGRGRGIRTEIERKEVRKKIAQTTKSILTLATNHKTNKQTNSRKNQNNKRKKNTLATETSQTSQKAKPKQRRK